MAINQVDNVNGQEILQAAADKFNGLKDKPDVTERELDQANVDYLKARIQYAPGLNNATRGAIQDQIDFITEFHLKPE